MANEFIVHSAYIDEAGARGKVRDLTAVRDHEFGLMSALVFSADMMDKAIERFTPGFDDFRKAMPAGAKVHFTDAFLPGNENWAAVANQVREDFIQEILATRPMIVHAA